MYNLVTWTILILKSSRGGVSALPLALACFLLRKRLRRAKQSPDGHRVTGKYAQHSLVEPLPPINRCSRGWHCSCCSPRRDSLSPHLLPIRKTAMGPSQNLTASFLALPRIGGSREGRKHWWVQNAGLKLVVCKINFRAKKIGGSRKVIWWVRNFCPDTLQHINLGLDSLFRSPLSQYHPVFYQSLT